MEISGRYHKTGLTVVTMILKVLGFIKPTHQMDKLDRLLRKRVESILNVPQHGKKCSVKKLIEKIKRNKNKPHVLMQPQ